MSRKNHKMVEGRLLQMDKKFSALKESQKTKIAEWFYEAYRKAYIECGKIPSKRENAMILQYVFQKIDEAGIWIPNREVYAYYNRRKSRLQKRLEKEFLSEETKVPEVFMTTLFEIDQDIYENDLREEGRLEIISAMYQSGMSIKQIASIVKKDIKELEEIVSEKF